MEYTIVHQMLSEIHRSEIRKNDRMLVAGAAGMLTLMVALIVDGTFTTVWHRAFVGASIGLAVLAVGLSASYVLLLENWLFYVSNGWPESSKNQKKVGIAPTENSEKESSGADEPLLPGRPIVGSAGRLNLIRNFATACTGATLLALAGLALLHVW